MNAYISALMANLSFAFGSQFFTYYTRKFSSLWMNTFKALVAAISFFLVILFSSGFHPIESTTVLVFLVSGFLALGIGDIFLLEAFKHIGPGRTMVLFGCHPVIVGIFSYFLFGQEVQSQKLIGILFFIFCLLIFSYEGFKSKGKWEVKGLVYAMLGMAIDAIGVIITRYGFDLNKSITAFEGNFYRCIGALLAFILIRQFKPFQFRANFVSLVHLSKLYVIIGVIFGTFLSLAFYLSAIQTATNLAVISAISITSVIFSSTFECMIDKTWPSRYLLFSFIFFGFGVYFIFK